MHDLGLVLIAGGLASLIAWNAGRRAGADEERQRIEQRGRRVFR